MERTAHPISQEELMAYLDGELAPVQAAAAAAHLEHCRECQSVAADLQSVSRHLLEWQIEQPEFPLRALAIEPVRAARRNDSSIFAKRWAWIAAAAVLVVIVAIPLWKSPSTHLQEYAQLQSISSQPAAIGGVAGNGAPTPPPQSPALSAGPQIIRTAELDLTTREFDKTQQEMRRLVATYHGYIAHLLLASPPDQGRTLDSTLRIPAAQLDTFLSALRKLGHVDSESQSGEEVTRQVIDLQARLDNARHTEQRLAELLQNRTGKLSDVLAVEEQIDRVRGEIEQLQAERDSLSHQIAFASLDFKLAEEYRAPLTADHSSLSTRLRNAAVDGYRGLADFAIGTVLFLLAYGPRLLILAAIVFFVARAIWERKKRAIV